MAPYILNDSETDLNSNQALISLTSEQQHNKQSQID